MATQLVSHDVLPHAALRGILTAAAVDHARATLMRARASDHNSRANKPRAYRLKCRSLRSEARALELLGQVRA